ncbi:MAG: type II toxin-antitoxin system HicA family toxin [Methylacidiphilales bacterium]|nr:type II toxin-antitoxin system HicA family toxin [Candidatus Methylacidiphilales bacterium]
MPKLPGINHLQAIRALEKCGFKIIRQGKHVILSDGTRTVVVPRNNPINAFTMGYIVKEAGMTVEQFRLLL